MNAQQIRELAREQPHMMFTQVEEILMTVRPVQWQGWCDRCGEPSPETRDSEAEAQRDVDECPCSEDD